MTAPVTTVDLDDFAQKLGQEIASALQPAYGESWPASTSRAWEPPGRPDPTETDVQERFLPLLAAILPAVVSTVPSIINDIRRRHRDLAPAADDPQQAQRDLQAVLAKIVPVLVESLPDLVATLDREPAELSPDDPEGTTRFLSSFLSGPMIPKLISAVPDVISVLAGGRRDLSATASADPELTSRFLGSILGSVLGPLASPIAAGLGGLFGGARPLPQRPPRPVRPRPARW